jgi:hypothetical protein
MAQLLLNNYNIGTDLQQVILVADNGRNIAANQLGHLEEISATQQVTRNTISPVLYQGKRLHRNIYHDWEGRLNFTRFNGDMTSLIQGIMDRFQQTGAETYFTLYCTVRDLGQAGAQTLDEYAFQRCVLDGHEMGPFTGLAEVKAPLTFRCQSLIIAGGGPNVLTSGPTVHT